MAEQPKPVAESEERNAAGVCVVSGAPWTVAPDVPALQAHRASPHALPGDEIEEEAAEEAGAEAPEHGARGDSSSTEHI